MNRLQGNDAISAEAQTTVPVYPHLPFVPDTAAGCELVTKDGQRILDLYGGHAVASLGYAHPDLTAAVEAQSRKLWFQSNAVALDIRASAARKLIDVAPASIDRVFFANSGAEANENALRIACMHTKRRKVVALTHGFHGRTAAAANATWNSDGWYGFPSRPFDTAFIPRDDVDAVSALVDADTAAVIFEPVQGVAGAYDLSVDFVTALRRETARHGTLLIADEVQSGMGRCGHFFAVQGLGIEPDIVTSAKGLGGGIPCGAVLCRNETVSDLRIGDLGSTFGGSPLACAAIAATIDIIQQADLLQNVRRAEAAIRDTCVAGPVSRIQGRGLLLGLVCDRPATLIRDQLLERNILTGTSAAKDVLRILAPLIIEPEHIDRLASALNDIPDKRQ